MKALLFLFSKYYILISFVSCDIINHHLCAHILLTVPSVKGTLNDIIHCDDYFYVYLYWLGYY